MAEEKQHSSIPSSTDESIVMEEASVSASKNNDSSDEELTSCPLFMTGLPRDFSTNPQLAALASLLDEDDKEEDVNDKQSDDNKQKKKSLHNNSVVGRLKTVMPSCGGGKVRMEKSRTGRLRNQGGAPPYYSKPAPSGEETKKKKKEVSSLGEAQLFLNMWKL